MNVVARPMAFVEVLAAAEMEQVEIVVAGAGVVVEIDKPRVGAPAALSGRPPVSEKAATTIAAVTNAANRRQLPSRPAFERTPC